MKEKMILIEICITLLMILFGYTALMKMLEYNKFIFQMRLSPLVLMRRFAPVLAVLVPLAEAVIVLALCLPGWRRTALWASVILLGIFEVYIAGMMLSGLKLGCTCGGAVSKLSWPWHLVFNAAFMLIGTVALRGLANKWPLRVRAHPVMVVHAPPRHPGAGRDLRKRKTNMYGVNSYGGDPEINSG